MDEIHNFQTHQRAHLTKEQRLPRYLKEVEKVIRSAKSCQSNFKSVLANSRLRGNFHKKVYSLTVNVLKYYNYIHKIIEKLHLLEKEKFLRREIASILIYEMIFGKNNLPGESKIITVIRAYEKDIMDAHEELQNSSFAPKELSIPRYVRIHTLITTVPYVIKDLESYGFKHIEYDNLSEDKYLELIENLEQGHFLIDFHFKDVLVFASSENLTSFDLYKNGHIFLQDKSSYIPVHVLNPEPGCAVLDACAAPGMKTVHIASKMKNTGVLIACERDKERFEVLKEMLQHGAVKICKTLCKDFKLLDPNDQAYSSVEYILLDPSCSGSGMVSRMDEVTDTENSKNKERLMKLAGFQIILLKHALKFPSVKKVVYSTCSINEEENEYVVHEALSSCYGEFKLVPVMPEWPVRGSENFEYGNMCLRTVPEKHLTNGFFVAMFERVNPDENRKKVHISKNKKNEIISVTDSQYEDNNVSRFKTKGKNKKRKWENSNEKEKISEIEQTDDFEIIDENIHNSENSLSASIQSDCVTRNKNKKHKGEKPTIEQTDNFEIDENLHNSENILSSSIQSDCVTYKKNKKLKSEKPQIEKNEDFEAMHKMSTSIQLDCVTSKKCKKNKIENTNDVKIINENLLNSESYCEISRSKKCKSKKHETEKIDNFEGKHKVAADDSERTFMYAPIESYCGTSTKNKKSKSKKHEVKKTEFEIVNENLPYNSENMLMCSSIQSGSVTGKSKEKHKNKKHKIENTDSESTFICASNQSDSITTKKSNQEIENTDDNGVIDENLQQSSENTLSASIQSNGVAHRKKKKHKSKKHEIENTNDSEDTFFCTPNDQSDCVIFKKNEKHESEKHKIEDFETLHETAANNSEQIFISALTKLDCVTTKQNRKHKRKKHDIEKSNDFEITDENHNSEPIFMSTPIQNEITKKNKKPKSKKHEIEESDDFKKTKETVPCNPEGVRHDFLCLPDSEEELQNILFKDFKTA